ncbi:hypothetical protein CW745_02155 [Psychromonas sp. psych-6C06]|uniref:hypothetical protein n=1 Tax=Psychromonas sp. psych-6C06 TaxID=2058089 RepID=UPI000C341B4E|nr:hypothetical protein [Psychromonas sp. psych-6C06]PKF63670.1 hypothetical protein CW745_02155 [Psychromonas sp. psych-6C06]
MLIVDYQSKSYQRFLNDLVQISAHKSRFLVTLNGGSEQDVETISSTFKQLTQHKIQHSDAISAKAPDEGVDSLFITARTERNILLLSKADLLFDKKTAVKNAHERDNGFNINNLFKNIAKHNGIVMLVTEEKQTLSASLSTKVDLLIRFPKA